LRLGLLLAGLVAVNVYVFFFNRRTAPREVLNLQSTSKTLDGDGSQRELLARDAAAAAAAMKPAVVAAPAAAHRLLPPKPRAAGQASPPVIQIPFAPPPEDGDQDRANGTVENKLSAADTLGQVLAREGFGLSGPAVIAALGKLLDPKTIRGGQKYVVRLDDQGTPQGFEYQPSAVLRYIVERDPGGAANGNGNGNGWRARKIEQPVEMKIVDAGGVVDSSLYESVQKAGESSALVGALVELFAWDVNFYVDTQPGDHWKVVVEKQLLGGRFYKYGRVLAAEYGGRVGTFRAFYWSGKGGGPQAAGRYYDERGQAVSKSMLKIPLRYVRISSKFDRRRLHPILHVEKAHLGIDYAAPVGTPVWASASGRVAEVGVKRGSGNTIVLAHPGGLTTRYYHLSRYARGLHAGQLVRQKDVIGYVGSTGLSTGPHLHFSVTKNGAFVDPGKLQVGRDPPVADRAAFLEAIRPRLAALKNIQSAAMARN
jgi:murein DD-endopeptidase MepM/ murein hydrolase activator NlpD